MPIIIDPSIANPPPPQVAVSPDGILTARSDPTNGGVLLEAQFPGSVGTWPHEVVFERVDGTRVRGGDPALSPGGFAVAYDREAPIGATTAWRAYPVPFHHRGEPEALGEPSDPVALQVTSAAGLVWLKAIDSASAIAVQPVQPMPVWRRPISHTLYRVPGSRYPSGAYGRRQAVTGTFTFVTVTLEQRAGVISFFDEGGPLLWQCHPMFGESDMFVLAGDLDETYAAAGDHPKRLWSVELTQVARPATVDSPLFVPERSYDEIAAQVSSHDEATAVWPLHRDPVR